jgi:hypothetical protein
VPEYGMMGAKKILLGTRTESRWQRVPVTKRVPYQAKKTIVVEEPVYGEKKVLSGYKTVIEKVPVYAEKDVEVGSRTVYKTQPVYEERQVQVGTETVTRQIPDYKTVKILVGYEDATIPKVETPESKALSKKIFSGNGDEISQVVEGKEYQVTDVVYLKGGPGAKSYGLKAEDGWSKHQYGGDSLPAMKIIGLMNDILVWIRDNTRIIELMGGKPDARAYILYSEYNGGKELKEIYISNTGNEIEKVESISLITTTGGKEEENHIFPPEQEIMDCENEILINPGYLSPPILTKEINIRNDDVNLIRIFIRTTSNRFGMIEYQIK